MIKRLRASPVVEIALVVINSSSAANVPLTEASGRIQTLWTEPEILLYRLYRRLDARLFRPRPDAFAPIDATEIIGDTAVMYATPIMTTYSDRLNADDESAIRSHDLDVLVRLGFRILRGDVLHSARYGVWGFHHGDNRVNRGGPAGVWEVLLQQSLTGTVLQILTEDLDDGLVLCRSFSATDPVSVARNRNALYWKSLAFIPRQLEALHRVGAEDYITAVGRDNPALSTYSHRLYTAPRNRELVRPLLRLAKRVASRQIMSRLTTQQWILLYDRREQPSSALWRFKPLVPPKGRFWADPHIVYRDGRHYIFIEELTYARGRGHIAVMTVDSGGAISDPRPVLTQPYHLSYPFVFEKDGEYYMVPESSENRTIDLYHCVDFPDRWELHRTLMADVVAVDTTLHQHNGRWWLFANMVEHDGASNWDELFLFSAPDPLSNDWTPHPMSPVVSDVRRARPAGRLFSHRGQLYRPSQDSSRGYGYGVRMNRVVDLSKSSYREEEVGWLGPEWRDDIRGIHTWSHEPGLTVVDARLRRRQISLRSTGP